MPIVSVGILLMSVWMSATDSALAQNLTTADGIGRLSLQLSQTAADRPICDEDALLTEARAHLTSHFDMELGAVAPGSSAQVGFQYLKTADSLLAAQAIAHDDFDNAANQFRRIISSQRADGNVPLIVYGPSVDATLRWIDNNNTFFPGPALWRPRESDPALGGGGGDASSAAAVRLPTSSILAPPIAADVALQMYHLSPYETAMGVVGHSTDAVQFLCDVYPALLKLHSHVFSRATPSFSNQTTSSLLAAQHPWETFSPFSSHWQAPLDHIKSLAGYDQFVRGIPSSAKTRFARGAAVFQHSEQVAVEQFYEPMVFLASCHGHKASCALRVHDVEFNALALRSADALVEIGRVLLDRSSTCGNFKVKAEQIAREVAQVDTQATALRVAITGNTTTPSRLWNKTAQIFNDDDDGDENQPTTSSIISSSSRVASLRGLLPAYAFLLEEDQMLGILSHFLPSSTRTFHFLCTTYPIPFFPCDSSDADDPSDADGDGDHAVTLLQYNYYTQRAFTMNQFPGLAMYLRNMTRTLVCASNSSSNDTNGLVPLAFRSNSGQAVPLVGDGFTGSSLAAALLINMLLPAVTPPPGPDTLPLDHRMLTIIMCVELIVALGVALGCVFLSVYFVVNRPQDVRGSPPPTTTRTRQAASSRRKRESKLLERGGATSVGGFSSSDGSPQSGSMSMGSSVDLEEGLLSEEEDQAYGSFQRQDRDGGGGGAGRDGPGPVVQPQPAAAASTSWHAVKEALASISPW